MGSKPLAIDLFCGLGGWTEGLLAAGYRVVGFDLERHEYGDHKYPGELVLQDVRTIDGARFKDAELIVASPPCQRYSYMAMPWKRAKAKIAWYRDPKHPERLEELNELFNACFRIQREASAAAGRHVPLVVENVNGAQRWVGRAAYHYGSFYLWGDVPALMPRALRYRAKSPGQDWNRFAATGETSPHWNVAGLKNTGGSWFSQSHGRENDVVNHPDGWERKKRNDPRDTLNHPGRALDGVKVGDRNVHRSSGGHKWSPHWTEGTKQGGDWFSDSSPGSLRSMAGKSSRRKAASALIAKIPFELAHYIARTYHPEPQRAQA